MEAAYIDTLEKEGAINSDIIKVLEKNFLVAHDEVKSFSKQFDAPTLYETAENVWHYLKKNVKYKADSASHQKIRLPARLLADGEGDCG